MNFKLSSSCIRSQQPHQHQHLHANASIKLNANDNRIFEQLIPSSCERLDSSFAMSNCFNNCHHTKRNLRNAYTTNQLINREAVNKSSSLNLIDEYKQQEIKKTNCCFNTASTSSCCTAKLEKNLSGKNNDVIDLSGYLIFITTNHTGSIKVYGSSADKPDLQIGDEILEINGECVKAYNHSTIISHIHDCIRSRTITLKVKRSIKTNELVINENLKEAFIIGVDEKAKERLNKLTKSKKVTPIDLEHLSKQFQLQQQNHISNEDDEHLAHELSSIDIANKILNEHTSTNCTSSSPIIHTNKINKSYSTISTKSTTSASSASSTSSSISISNMVKHQFDSPYQDKLVGNQQPVKMITFNPSMQQQQQASMAQPSPTSSTTSTKSMQQQINSLNKRPAPLAPSHAITKVEKHEPFVKIKDNQIMKFQPPKPQIVQPKPQILTQHKLKLADAQIKLSTSTSSSTKSNKSIISSIHGSESEGSNNGQQVLPLSSSSSSSSSSHSSVKSGRIVDAEKHTQELVNSTEIIENVNNENYCSTSSVSSSSGRSAILMLSSPPLPTVPSEQILNMNATSKQTNTQNIASTPSTNVQMMTFDEFNSTSSCLLVDQTFNSQLTDNPNVNNQSCSEGYHSREMAIDCPDNFVPEIKTKPCYPPQSNISTSNILNNVVNVPDSTKSQSNKNNNILKPLFTIINNKEVQNELKSNSNAKLSKEEQQVIKKAGKKSNKKSKNSKKSTESAPKSEEKYQEELKVNTNQVSISERDQITPVNSLYDKSKLIEPLMSTNSSSIRYIDEDTRSRILAGLLTTGVSVESSPICNKITEELDDNEANKIHDDEEMKQVSVGKKLFEKQKQTFEQLFDTNSNFAQDMIMNININSAEVNSGLIKSSSPKFDEAFELINEEAEFRKLREKQEAFLRDSLRNSEKLKNLSSSVRTTRTSEIKHGMVNDGFVMDGDRDEDAESEANNKISSIEFSLNIVESKLTSTTNTNIKPKIAYNKPTSANRPPTPPPRQDQITTCANQIDLNIIQNDLIINSDNKAKLVEQFQHLTSNMSQTHDSGAIKLELNQTNNYFKMMKEKSIFEFNKEEEAAISPIFSSNAVSPSSSSSASPPPTSTSSHATKSYDYASSNDQQKLIDSSIESTKHEVNEDDQLAKLAKTLEIQDLFKHIDQIQSRIEALKLETINKSSPTSSSHSIKDNYYNLAPLNKLVTSKPALHEDLATLEKFFATCDQDVNLLLKLYETDSFKNTLGLYNKLIKLNATLSLKPITNNSHQLSQEIMKFIESIKVKINFGEENDDSTKSLASSSSSSSSSSTSTAHYQLDETANELCHLLSKIEIQNLLVAHDELAKRYDERTSVQQMQNMSLMSEQKQRQQYLLDTDKEYELNSVDCNDYVNLLANAPCVVTNERADVCDSNKYATTNQAYLSENDEHIIEQHVDDDQNNQFLSDEGRYLLSKAQHYSVDNLKLVNIEKPDAPLGATIRNRDGSIIIGRIVVGGAAEQSGLLHEDDEILEINSIPVRGKTINDVCDMICNLQGIVSFLIIPNMNYEPSKIDLEQPAKSQKIIHIRALFNYVPQEDLYIPCKELGLGFSKGDILHIISQEDEDWWQAYRDDEKDQSLAGLIPAQSFQERRCSQMQALIGDSFMNRKKREKGFCIRGIHKNKRRRVLNDHLGDEIVTYEEVTLYKPPTNRKRPIVLIGPHSIGRHELRKRLMQSSPSLFEVAVPHTTRQPRRDEIDGKDYHFLPRHIFEADIKQGRFIEHGEYEKNLYGTSRESIKRVIENSKICVLNLYPQALKTLRNSDLMPYVIYIGPPNLAKLKELKNKLGENYRENDLLDIIDKGREIEELYGHYFDKIIRNTDMDKTYQELVETITRVQNEENWVPTNWLNR